MKHAFERMGRRVTAMVLALCMMLGMVSTAFAADYDRKDVEEAIDEVLKNFEEQEALAKDYAEEIVAYVAANYESAYIQAYQYALENGYIDAAEVAIGVAIETVAGIGVDQAEVSADLKAELDALKVKVIETLGVAKASIRALDALDQESLDALMAVLKEAEEAALQMLVVLEGANEEIIAPALAAAYEEIGAMIAEIEAKLQEAVAAGTEWLENKAQEIYDAVVDVLTKAEKEAEIAAGKLAEVLAGYNTALKAELDKIVAQVKAQIEALEKGLEELEQALSDKVAAIEKELAALYAQLETANGELKAQIEKQIAQLEAELAALKEQVEKQIAVVEAQIAALKVLVENAANNVVAVLEAVKALQAEVAELVELAKQAALDAVVGALEAVDTVLEELDAALRTLIGELYEAAKDAVVEAANKLVAAIVAAVKKYAPQMADAVYEYLYNNPEEVIEFVKNYGPYVWELVEEYGDEMLAVVGFVLYNYGDEMVEFIIDNHEEIVAALNEWFGVHGENAAALLQVYAAALGLCDAVREQVAALEKALEDLQAALNNKAAAIEAELAALYAQLETAVGEAKAQIEAQIAALEAELAALKADIEAQIAAVKAQIAELKALLEETVTNVVAVLEAVKALQVEVAELIAQAKKAALDAVVGALEAVDTVLEELDAALRTLIGELYEAAKDAVVEAANKLVAAIVAAVKKYAPQMADAVYEYLYNNPEEVIEFVKNYGPYVWELVEEYGDEMLAVVGFVLYNYGDEMVEFIIDNHEEIVAALNEWFGVHGENAAALLQVYAAALGLCDAVREQVAALEKALEDLQAALNNKAAAIEAELAALYAQLENATGELQAQIEKQIAQLEAQLAVLQAQIEAQIAVVEAQIAALKAELAKLQAQIDALVKKLVTEVNAQVEALVAEIEKTIGEIEKLTVKELQEAVEKLQAMVETQLDAAAAAIAAKIAEGVAALEALLDKADQAVLNAINALVAALEQLYYDATHADYEVNEDSFYVSLGDSTVTGMNTGDPAYGNFGYKTKVPTSAPYKLAEALGLDVETQYEQLALAGLRMADLRYILDETFVPDQYTLTRTKNRVDHYAGGFEQMRADYIAALSKADLVTVSVGNCNFTDFISGQVYGALAELINHELADWLNNKYFGSALKEAIGQFVDLDDKPYELDWEGYIGAEGVVELEKLLAEVKAKLIAEGIPEVYTIDVAVMLELDLDPGQLVINIPVVDLLTYMMESYLYGYVTFAMDYAEVFNKIHEIAPEAELVILGMYNPNDELVLYFGDVELPLGEYYGYLLKTLSAHFLGYAMVTPKTTYVSVYETESFTDVRLEEEGSEYDLLDYLFVFGENSADFHATADGHTYMKDQILKALNVTKADACLLGDVNMDGMVDSLDTNILYRYANDDETLGALSDAQLVLGDVNKDGMMDSLDTNILYRYANDDETLNWTPVDVKVSK